MPEKHILKETKLVTAGFWKKFQKFICPAWIQTAPWPGAAGWTGWIPPAAGAGPRSAGWTAGSPRG